MLRDRIRGRVESGLGVQYGVRRQEVDKTVP